MSERLPEFNRYALRKKLQSEAETEELVQQVIELVQNTYPDRYAFNGNLNVPI